MITFEVNTKSIEYYESDLLPAEASELFCSAKPLPANITVSADEHRGYCDLTLQHPDYSTGSGFDIFSRERQFLKKYFSMIEQFETPNMKQAQSYNYQTTLKIKIQFGLDQKSRKEIENAINMQYLNFYRFKSYEKSNSGYSYDFEWVNVLVEGVKTLVEVLDVYFLIKEVFEKLGFKDSQTEDIPDSEFESQYEKIQIEKYLIAVSREINSPLDRFNVNYKSISIDGTYMRVEADGVKYSCQFDNNHKLVMINIIDDGRAKS